MDIELTKQYLEDVIDLEMKKVVTEKMYEELVIEENEWNRKISYSPAKGFSSMSIGDMLVSGAKTLGVCVVLWIVFLFVGAFADIRIEGIFINLMLILIFVVSIFVLPIVLPIAMKIQEVKDVNKDYNYRKEQQEYVENHGEKAVSIITYNQNQLRTTYKFLNDNLTKAYSTGFIYKKYQTMEACATILEYLESGRCYELEGPNGAYNKYEDEMRDGLIISTLGQISMKMDTIIENQRSLESAVRMVAKNINEMTENIKLLCDTVQNIDGNIEEIAATSKITAWSSAVIATQVPDWNSEAMKKANQVG